MNLQNRDSNAMETNISLLCVGTQYITLYFWNLDKTIFMQLEIYRLLSCNRLQVVDNKPVSRPSPHHLITAIYWLPRKILISVTFYLFFIMRSHLQHALQLSKIDARYLPGFQISFAFICFQYSTLCSCGSGYGY